MRGFLCSWTLPSVGIECVLFNSDSRLMNVHIYLTFGMHVEITILPPESADRNLQKYTF